MVTNNSGTVNIAVYASLDSENDKKTLSFIVQDEYHLKKLAVGAYSLNILDTRLISDFAKNDGALTLISCGDYVISYNFTEHGNLNAILFNVKPTILKKSGCIFKLIQRVNKMSDICVGDALSPPVASTKFEQNYLNSHQQQQQHQQPSFQQNNGGGPANGAAKTVDGLNHATLESTAAETTTTNASIHFCNNDSDIECGSEHDDDNDNNDGDITNSNYVISNVAASTNDGFNFTSPRASYNNYDSNGVAASDNNNSGDDDDVDDGEQRGFPKRQKFA